MRTWLAMGLCALFLTCALAAPETPRLSVERDDSGVTLRLDGEPFHRTDRALAGARLVAVPGGTSTVIVWNETDASGNTVPHYALGLDGAPVGQARATSYDLRLNYGSFSPGREEPDTIPALRARNASRLHIVQFVTQPLEDYRDALAELGASVRGFLPHHAHIVEMPPALAAQVSQLDFVRWVGAYHPAYRLEAPFRADAATLAGQFEQLKFNILLFDHDRDLKRTLGERIKGIGGILERDHAGKFLMEATLTPEQLLEVAQWDEIAYIDRWRPMEQDMDLVRAQGGAVELETVAGYTGAGVRGESFDSGFNVAHPDFASRPPLEHGGTVGNASHGTACLGILFGDGAGDAQALGLMPDGQPIAADHNNIGISGGTRYDHTAELKQAPYFAVFQTASVGDSRTFDYTTISAEHDTILFDHDVLHCQSQSNAGNQDSRPQAWAKNVVSGGAFEHYNTADTSDDCWCETGSIGPAADGRIKPDLSFYYDDTYTTYTTGSGYGEFGGTSGATPSICGHFGLFFQMWSDGIFGNEVAPGATVFDSRPHMTTAKAVMINTAIQYPFTGPDHDMTRVHQGWGVPNVKNLHDLRDNLSIIDESVLLTNTETAQFNTFVEAGEPALRVTMTYADPAGNPAAALHRINDLTLKATAPGGTVWWGNVGLRDGNWSLPGGSADTIDTVENIFVQNPEAGMWVVEVIASEIVQDSHVETPELDADFALVTSGGLIIDCTSDASISFTPPAHACEDTATVRVVDCDPNLDDALLDTVTVQVFSTSDPSGEAVVLTETNPASGTFVGTVPVSEFDDVGIVGVAEGDLLTAEYLDADDGMGGIDLLKTANGSVDCSSPMISNVQAPDVAARRATITFDTDEAARGTVRYGTTCSNLDGTAGNARFETAHSVLITGLQENSDYYYAVDAVDTVGNASTDDNGGLCHRFTTPDVADAFTESFTGDQDTDGITQTFSPNGSGEFYEGCTTAAAAFPTDPAGGTTVSLGDDASSLVTLTGATVSLYGTSYSEFYIGSNGFITFTTGDTDYTETLEDHFRLPRISGLFDDLNPSSAGTVSWRQLADRVAVTWENVPEYSTSNQNSFQIEMFFDGTLAITTLATASADSIVGLSAGNGTPADFVESDLGSMSVCGATGGGAVPGEAGIGVPLTVTGYDRVTDTLTLSYGVPCQAVGHTIEYAPLTRADLQSYAWSGQECGLDTSGVHAWNASGAPQSMFFIVVAHNGSEEGSYGQAGDGSERPEDVANATCPIPQNLVDVCE